MKLSFLIVPAIIASISIFAVPASATETRCGWLYNPTPRNWYLIDKDSSWIISRQGGYEAKGMDNLPTYNEKEYVKTNGYYGYGCACMDVATDSARLRISEIRGGESLPLSTCRQDPNVPKSP
jgi:hypothetical protein